MEPLYLIPIWVGQNFTAIGVEILLAFSEFHCNRCGNLIGFLNSINENIYEIIEDETLLCTNCIALKN
jgi:hypothetical protein